MYSDNIEDKVLLTESVKRNNQKCEPVELFKTFFSNEMEEYVIYTCKGNGF